VDGSRDLALRLPRELAQGIDYTAAAPTGFVVAARLIEESKYGLFVAGYDRHGRSTWTRKLVSDDATLRGPDGLFVGADGDILLAGTFSGCVRFAPKAKRICSDDKALAKYLDCEGDCDSGQPFVATFDQMGELKSCSLRPATRRLSSRAPRGASPGPANSRGASISILIRR
jgi:hypothetical protein